MNFDSLLLLQHAKNKTKEWKKETESITLRIDKNILDELRNEAEQKMESINTHKSSIKIICCF